MSELKMESYFLGKFFLQNPKPFISCPPLLLKSSLNKKIQTIVRIFGIIAQPVSAQAAQKNNYQLSCVANLVFTGS